MKQRYTLLDAEAQATAHPKTFTIPTSEKRNSAGPGCWVKLCFKFIGKARDGFVSERMWVQVTGKGIGKLDNDPAMFRPSELKLGDVVEFEPRHILDIVRNETSADEAAA